MTGRSEPLVQTGRFTGISRQSLRNVSCHAATIIWVQKGQKHLWWQEKTISYDASQWLVVPAGRVLTFVNVPDQASYDARSLVFLEKPPGDWLDTSASAPLSAEPRIQVTPELRYCFETVFHMQEEQLCYAAQRQFIFGFFAQLKNAGALSLLFPVRFATLKEKIAGYLSVHPADEHRLETVADHFFMSRSTLIRKLSDEGTTFRQLLTNVRMVHALNLMQRSRDQLLSIALSCGYHSEARFSSRFKKTFGLTPSEYRKTTIGVVPGNTCKALS